MGKPYHRELERLPDTFEEACELNISPLVEALGTLTGRHVYTVGSGGSVAAASLVADLHCRLMHAPASCVTPLRLARRLSILRDTGVIFLSGGGSNPDVLEAFRLASSVEPRRLLVVCGRKGSPLAALARRVEHASVFEFSLSSGRDGFLATNSLLAAMLVLTRAYGDLSGAPVGLSTALPLTMPGQHRSFADTCAELTAKTQHLWHNPNVALLYGASVEAAATDFESRFTEAALCAVQPADLRNFAHGRHYWLAVHARSTSVLILHTEVEKTLTSKTLELIPKAIRRASLCAPEGPLGALGMVVTTMVLAGACGRARGVDPGRPHVPRFGRSLYHLKGLGTAISSRQRGPDAHTAMCIERKLHVPVSSLGPEQHTRWKDALATAIETLASTTYSGIALDYDGTLCDRNERHTGPRVDIVSQLKRILSASVPMVVVTGRGKSVGEALRRVLPRTLWDHVRVSYYNGAQTLPLEETPEQGTPQGELLALYDQATSSPHYAELGKWEGRGTQVTLSPHPSVPLHAAWERVQQLVQPRSLAGLRVVRSGHTVDILAPGIQKSAALSHLGSGCAIVLRVGDSGRFPGNDFDLLDSPFGLSCGEVSSSPDACWNLSPPGVLGVQATARYLRWVRPLRSSGRFRLRVGTGEDS